MVPSESYPPTTTSFPSTYSMVWWLLITKLCYSYQNINRQIIDHNFSQICLKNQQFNCVLTVHVINLSLFWPKTFHSTLTISIAYMVVDIFFRVISFDYDLAEIRACNPAVIPACNAMFYARFKHLIYIIMASNINQQS